MHIECPQFGNTIIVPFSMHIPHSSSLSRSLSETSFRLSSRFLLKTSVYSFLVSSSSNSINSPRSCLSEGYITAATGFQSKTTTQKCGNPEVFKRSQIKRTYHKIPLNWLSFLLRKTLKEFHQHIPKPYMQGLVFVLRNYK